MQKNVYDKFPEAIEDFIQMDFHNHMERWNRWLLEDVVMLFSLNLCYNRTNTIIEEYEDV
jgi:hypothetical protein